MIGYCKYQDGHFSKWQVTMDKHWHLSYPNVFVRENELYMCPESYQNEEVCLYRLIEFPDKWEKVEVLFKNVRYVDSTFLYYKGQNYMFTFEPLFKENEGRLYIFLYNGEKYVNPIVITDKKEIARPGGNFIIKNEKIIRVSQNSETEYGDGLIFSEVLSLNPYAEKIVKKVYPKDINILSNKKYRGIHTYNSIGNIEVIDLKVKRHSLVEYLAKKRIRKVFVKKY